MAGKETIREALNSLWSSKQRTLLALLGIVIGIGSVIAMVSVGEVVKHESLKQFQEMGTDVITISVQSRGSGPGRPNVRLKDARDIPVECADISIVAPYTSTYVNSKIGGNSTFMPVLGVTRSFFGLNKIGVAEGRAISDLDITMFYCVIGQQMRERLAAMGVTEVIGHKMFLLDRLFTVVGVLERVEDNMMRPSEMNQGVLIPITTALRLPDGGEISSILSRISPGGDWRKAQSQVTSYFTGRVKGLEVNVRSAEMLLKQIQKQMQLFTLLLGTVGSISLIVGGVGVMNVMLVSVSERKREIGIRRALGARRKDIQYQFLAESITLCLAGGMLGIVLGVGACALIARFNAWEFLVSWMAVWLGVGVSCLVGVFFGYYPARQAAQMKPIEALRDN